MTTPKLSLVEIAQAQADKYATHNEALRGLDALLPKVAIAVQHTPPGAPSNGDVYIISDGSPTATGAWAGQDGDVAWYNGAWNFVTPVQGWVVYVQGESAQWVFDGTNWSALAGDSGTLDGLDSTQFLRSDVADTADALISFAAGIGSGGSKVAETTTNGLYFGTGVSGSNRGALTNDATDVTLHNYVEGGTVIVSATSGGSPTETRTLLDGDPDGAVSLYHENVKVVETDSAGIKIAGSSAVLKYEEGTWTPVLTFATPGDLSVVYSTQAGEYERIGRLVTIRMSLVTSTFTHTTASGAVQITGLPFTSASSNTSSGSMSVMTNINKSGFTQVVPHISGSTTTLTFNALRLTGLAQSQVQASNMPTGTNLNWNTTITYRV